MSMDMDKVALGVTIVASLVGGGMVAAASSPDAKLTGVRESKSYPVETAGRTVLDARDMKIPITAKLFFEGSDRSAQQLSYTLRVSNHLKVAATTRHSIELVDDRGRSVIEPFQSADDNLGQGTSEKTLFRLPTPQHDGYYLVRASVVAADSAGVAASVRTVGYLEVQNGNISAISRRDFNDLSRINEGRRL